MSNINDLYLEFDEDACFNDLILALVSALQKCFDQLKDDMKSRSGGGRKSKRASNISYDFISTMTYKMAEQKIVGIVGNTHWEALIDNFGSGSRMERDKSVNPWLTWYLGSKYFNKDRKMNSDLRVLARPSVPYEQPDWEWGDGYSDEKETGRGRVKRIGSGLTDRDGSPLDLENNRSDATGMPFYTPIKGKYWFNQVWEQAEAKIDEYLEMALDEFDFNKYLKGGGD